MVHSLEINSELTLSWSKSTKYNRKKLFEAEWRVSFTQRLYKDSTNKKQIGHKLMAVERATWKMKDFLICRCVCVCGRLGRTVVRLDTYVYNLFGFWPVQNPVGTHTTPRLCPELPCRCERNRAPYSCSSCHLERREKQRESVRGFLLFWPMKQNMNIFLS